MAEADTSRPGSWGIKKAEGREGQSLASARRQSCGSRVPLVQTAAAGLPAGPRDAFPSAVPGLAETAALAVVAQGRAALSGAECGGAENAFREKPAGCEGSPRPLLRPPTPASLTARPPALFPLTLNPLPLGYLPLSASSLATNSSPLSHCPRSCPSPVHILAS